MYGDQSKYQISNIFSVDLLGFRLDIFFHTPHELIIATNIYVRHCFDGS